MRHALLIAAITGTALVPFAIALLPAAPDDVDVGAGGVGFLVALVLLSTISVAVGVTILWRRTGNRIGRLLVAGGLIMSSGAATWWILVVVGLTSRGPLQTVLTWWAVVSILPAVFLLFASVGVFFPDGHLPGPRWRGPYVGTALALVIGLILQSIAAPSDATGDSFVSPFAIPGVPSVAADLGAALAIGGVLAAFLLALASVVVRYRRSVGVERQQVKWLVGAVLLTAILFPVSYLADVGPEGLLDILSVCAGCLIPIAIGIAVLRYRLYDIDRVISRTVSWSLVTAGILAFFVVLVVGLQAALAGFTQGETVAVALSTIVAAALFQPVRRRVQRSVDRRFDRGRYDGEAMAAAFAERLRNDLDLDALTADLRETVGMAVRPAGTDIWLPDRLAR